MIISICMDCKKVLGKKNDSKKSGFSGISHGLCPKCRDKRLEEIAAIKADLKPKIGIVCCFMGQIAACAAYWIAADILVF